MGNYFTEFGCVFTGRDGCLQPASVTRPLRVRRRACKLPDQRLRHRTAMHGGGRLPRRPPIRLSLAPNRRSAHAARVPVPRRACDAASVLQEYLSRIVCVSAVIYRPIHRVFAVDAPLDAAPACSAATAALKQPMRCACCLRSTSTAAFCCKF